MKLDFLEDINEFGDHTVRLSDFDKAQAVQFKQVLETLVKTGREVDLNEQDFIEAVNCGLTLRVSDTDEGIITEEYALFYCDLTVDGYKKMIRLVEPFCNKESRTFQWLYELDNPIDFLFSAGKIAEKGVIEEDNELSA